MKKVLYVIIMAVIAFSALAVCSMVCVYIFGGCSGIGLFVNALIAYLAYSLTKDFVHDKIFGKKESKESN